MRTLISTSFVSLDGVMEAPGGEPGYRDSGSTSRTWSSSPPAYEIKGREQEEATAMLLGQNSRGVQPGRPGMEDFAEYNAMPKYVVSTTLTDDDLVSDWGRTTILRSLDEVAALKETEGGPIIVHGSATLNRNLSDAGLIDRYHLLVFPLLLGAGKRLFSEPTRTAKLDSSSTRPTPTVCRRTSSTSSADNSRAWSMSTARGIGPRDPAPEARGAPQVPGRLGGQPVTAMSSGPFVNRPPVSLRRPARPSGAVRGKSGSPSSLMSEARARATRERTVATGQLRARAASA